VVVLAQGHAIRRVIIPTRGKRHDVSCVDKSNFPFRNQNPEAASAALKIVHLENLPTKRRGPSGDWSNFGCRHLAFADQAPEPFTAPGEIPRDDSLTH
jgi:hypothetical protein